MCRSLLSIASLPHHLPQLARDKLPWNRYLVSLDLGRMRVSSCMCNISHQGALSCVGFPCTMAARQRIHGKRKVADWQNVISGNLSDDESLPDWNVEEHQLCFNVSRCGRASLAMCCVILGRTNLCT